MNMRNFAILLAIGVIAVVGLGPRPKAQSEQPAASGGAATLPKRPEQIAFPPLAFEPPDAATFRRVLPDGTVVYLAPSREFPLVNIAITFKGGVSLDPADAPGLVAMTAKMVREGGTLSTSSPPSRPSWPTTRSRPPR